MDNSDISGPLAAFGVLQLIGFLLGIVVLGIVPVVCFWRILAKAAFCSPRWALISFIPGGQIVLLIVLAAAEW